MNRVIDRWLLATGLLLLVCLASLAPPVAAADQVIGHPQLTVSAPDNRFQPGETSTLHLRIANEGAIILAGPADYVDRVTTARATRIEVTTGDSPIEVRTGPYPVGTVPTGTTGPIPIEIAVPERTPPGTYTLPVQVRYAYTRLVDYSGANPTFADATANERLSITVRVTAAPHFTVVAANTSGRVGDRGPLTIALRNDGTEAVQDATLQLTSRDPALNFGGDTTVSTVIGQWGIGVVHRLAVPVDVAPGAPVRPYTLDATVTYTRPDGVTGSKTVTTTVTPRGAPDFTLAAVDAALRVGGRGTVRARVTNTGPTTARDAVVTLVLPWTNRTEAASVGDVAPGATAEARFTPTVPDALDPGPQRLTFRIDHEISTGARRQVEPLGTSVTVGPRHRPIAVTPVAATFPIDGDGPLRVALTNQAGEPITAVRATLTATDPLSSNDPVAYVPRLADGASTTVAFHLEVSEDAVAGDHPASISFTYDDSNGTVHRVEDVPLGVTVVEPTGPGFPVEALAIAILAGAAGAVWWYRRR